MTHTTHLPESPLASKADPVVIIGGGLAGLTAAAELSCSGRAVQVYDGASRLGGRAMTVAREGFRFNLGPRALYAQGVGRRILDRLGVPYSGDMPSLARPWTLIGDAVKPLPFGFWSLLTCSWMSLGERFETARFLARLSDLEARNFEQMSAADWLQTDLRLSRSRDFAEALVRLSTYSADHEALSAEIAVRQLQVGLQGVLYLDGGWQTLVDGLREIATQNGALVESGRRMVRVEEQDDRVLCETADGEILQASKVVVAVPPDQAVRLLGTEGIKLRTRACHGVYAASLDLALSRLPHPERTFALGVDRPFYFSVHSAAADLAPEGGALLHVVRYLRAEESLGRARVRGELEEILDLLQPGWRAHQVAHQFLPRMAVCHDQGGPGRQRAHHQLSDSVFLAGDWVGQEGMLADTSIASGSQVAQAILKASDENDILRVA